MEFWLPEILDELPQQLLCNLHRNVCRLRSTPTRKPTARSWYYRLPWQCIVWYHAQVIGEMARRGWNPSPRWSDPTFRGPRNKRQQGYIMKAPNRSVVDSFYNSVNTDVNNQRVILNAWKSKHRGAV